jgi:hypothetical protein
MQSSPTRKALSLLAALPGLLLVLLLAACGGRSDSLMIGDDGAGDDGGVVGTEDGGGCGFVSPCPSGAPWDPAVCACVLQDDAGQPYMVDAASTCPDIACPQGTFFEQVGNQCMCVTYPVDASVDDVWVGYDSGVPDSYVGYDQYVGYDSPITYYDAYPQDAPYYYDSPFCGFPVYCGTGYTSDQYCNCVRCSLTCPAGQEPAAGCGSCQACQTYACPAGFDQGPNCGCVPHGLDAGPPPPPADGGGDGGAGCVLESYNQCALGSWCPLGTCPDNKTQYGCYCNNDGTATCNLNCPAPPVCNIPGLGTCATGQTCLFGQCQGDAGSILYCSCQYGGQAYCNTLSCANNYFGDAGPTDAGTSDAGPSCFLEGYQQCPVGQYCQLGSCQDGTPYGCTCNADGTTDCNLICPPPAPCTIPGLGTCPYNQTCTFGSCTSSTSTQLSCYCQYGGQASCYTTNCGGGVGASE